MARRQAAFRQTDVSRAIRGAQAVGMPLAGVRITPEGEIFVAFVESPKTATTAFDEWKAKNDARKA
jgi:hypothetical protein